MSKKTNRVLSLMLSVLMVLQLSFGTGIGGMQNVKAQDDLTENQVSQEETVEPKAEDTVETEDMEETEQPVEAAAEEPVSLKVKINGIEKEVTLLDTVTSYQDKEWTNAEVSYTNEEISEETNQIFLKGGAEGSSIEAGTSYSSSTGFSSAFGKGKDGWSRGGATLKNLYAAAENKTIYVEYTAADGSKSYIQLLVKKAAQQGTAFLTDPTMGYSESTPGTLSSYQENSTHFYGMIGNPAIDFGTLVIYENGTAVASTKTLAAYSANSTAFAYKYGVNAMKMGYVARPGRYWIKTTTEYNGTTYTGYLPLLAALNASNIQILLTRAENTMAAEGYAELPEELRTMLETAKKNLENGKDNAAKPVYLDADDNVTFTNTGMPYYDRFGKQMDGGRLLENDATVVLDMIAIAATYKTDAALAEHQLAAYKEIAAVDVEAVQNPTDYREKVIAVKNAKYALLSTKSLEEINAILTGLGLENIKEAAPAGLTFGENAITDHTMTSANLNYTSSAAGTVYYLIQDVGAEVPDADKVMAEGKSVAVEAKEVKTALSGLTVEAKKIYLVLKTDAAVSEVYTVELPEAKILTGATIGGVEINFDGNDELTCYWEAGDTQFRLKPMINNSTKKDTAVNLTFKYQSLSGTDKETKETGRGVFTWFRDDFIALGGEGNDMTVIAELNGIKQTYTIHVLRESKISSLTVLDSKNSVVTLTPIFNKTKTEYTATVLENVNSVRVCATDPAADTNPETSRVLYNNRQAGDDGYYSWRLRKATNTLTVKAENGSAKVVEYNITIKRVPSVALTVSVDPEDALFALYNSDKQRIWPEDDGTFYLYPNQDYTYTVAKSGYVGQTGTLNLAENTAKEFSLERAPETEPLPSLKADYPGFRAGSDNQSVMDVKTPITKESIEVKWERQMGDYVSPSSGSTPIIVGDKIYTQSGGKVYMLDKETGETLKSADAVANAGFNLIPMTYGDGMLFVLLSNGIIQCYNASTLESLWIYKDPMGGGCNSPIRYDNGYIYIGFQNRKANFVCISATDEDPTNPKEEKVPIWRVNGNGYQWDGAWTNEKYVFVVDQTGRLLCMDKATGEMVQCIQTKASKVRSDISYYNGRIYFSTQSGYLYSYNIAEDGKVDTENLIEPLFLGSSTTSTSTPAVYNNRLYIGISNGGNFGTEGFAILVADIDEETGALSVAYLVPTDGYCQTSGLIVKGYEKETGYVYVYFLANSAHGTLYMIKDAPGMKEADPESGAFYTPSHEQFCIASAVADSDGNIYMKNDSAWQFTIRRSDAYLKNIELEGGNAVLDGGKAFAGSISEHMITVDAGTETLKMKLTPSDGAEVTINGAEGTEQEIKLNGNKTVVEVQVKAGTASRSYIFTVIAGPILTSMKVTDSPNAGQGTVFSLDPAFDSLNTEYTAGIAGAKRDGYIWLSMLNDTDVLEPTVVSGVYGYEEGDVLKVRTNYKGDKYIDVPFAERTNPTTAVVKLVLKNADGSQERVYNVTLYTQNALPILTVGENALKERTDTSAKITVNASKASTLYYLVQAASEEAPDAAKIQAEGKSQTAEAAGEVNVDLTELSKKAQKVYMILKDENGNVSAVRSLDIPQIALLGDVNDDGVVNLSDAIALLNKVTAQEEVDLAVGDVNGDGVVNLQDAIALLNKVTAQ